MDQMILPFKRYAEFSGRSARSEYWMFQLLQVIILIFCLTLIFVGAGERGIAGILGIGWSATTTVGVALYCAWVVISIIPHIALTVRRFHDQNLAGWMVLFYFLPWVGGLVIFVFMCIPGTAGENKYGSDSKHSPSAFAAISQADSAISNFPSASLELQRMSLSGFDGSGHVVKLIIDPRALAEGRKRLTIGRTAGADLRINDQAISREHAEIGLSGSTIFIEDLGSTNGTIVNGRRLKSREVCELWSGDTVVMGKLELMVSAV